jgi:hypothetical protein
VAEVRSNASLITGYRDHFATLITDHDLRLNSALGEIVSEDDDTDSLLTAVGPLNECDTRFVPSQNELAEGHRDHLGSKFQVGDVDLACSLSIKFE